MCLWSLLQRLTFNLSDFSDLSKFSKRNTEFSAWEQGFLPYFYSTDL